MALASRIAGAYSTKPQHAARVAAARSKPTVFCSTNTQHTATQRSSFFPQHTAKRRLSVPRKAARSRENAALRGKSVGSPEYLWFWKTTKFLFIMNVVDPFESSDDDRDLPPRRKFRKRQYYELENFEERFRLSRKQVDDLLVEIGPDLKASTQRCVISELYITALN